MDEVLVFARDEVPGAYAYFWEDFNPEEHLPDWALEMADCNFWDWLTYDYRIKGEKLLIDHYLAKAKVLSQLERAVLNKMKAATLSLFEVQQVLPEEGLVLEDLLLGGQYRVTEKAATRHLVNYDLLAARLLEIDGHQILSGGVYSFPTRDKAYLVGEIKKCFKAYLKKHPGSSLRDFLKAESILFKDLWIDHFLKPFSPALTTSDGEPLLFSKAVFGFSERDRVIDGLKMIKGMEPTEEGFFQWFQERQNDPVRILLGTIAIGESTLTLECVSRERLERGKALVLGGLQEAIIHKADMFKDPVKALRERDPEKPAPESRIPKEVEKQIQEEFLRKHYEKWLDEKIPALNGKSPRETVKQPRGRKKVVDLLKLLENMEARKQKEGELAYDVSWLWERLGLEKE